MVTAIPEYKYYGYTLAILAVFEIITQNFHSQTNKPHGFNYGVYHQYVNKSLNKSASEYF